jgi:hypothetical protein
MRALVSTATCGTDANGVKKICGLYYYGQAPCVSTAAGPSCACPSGQVSVPVAATGSDVDSTGQPYSRTKCACDKGYLSYAGSCYRECLCCNFMINIYVFTVPYLSTITV